MTQTSNTPDILAISCEVAIEAVAPDAGDGALPRFSMVAYTGGPIRTLGFAYPVVVNLDGMTIPTQRRPVRFQHSAFEGVGHTERIAIEDGKLIAEGVVSRDTKAAQEIVASGKKGFPWQASIGASVDEIEFIKRDVAVTVNGRKFKGPVYIAHKTTLNEISFVDLGADQQTSARIAAQHQQHSTQQEIGSMPETPSDQAQTGETNASTAPTTIEAQQPASTVPAPKTRTPGITASDPAAEIDQITAKARAESERRQRIQEMTAEVLAQRPELADELGKLAHAALEAGWKPDKYQLELMRIGRSYEGVAMPRRQEDRLNGSVIEAALCFAGGLDTETLEANFSEQTLDAANRQYRHGLGLCETLLIFAQANGYRGYGRSDLKGLLQFAFADVQAAGLSTMSLPGILSNVANKFLRAGFDAVESTWRDIAAIRSVRDFKQVSSYSLTGGFVYEEIPPGGELKHATVGETAYTNQAKTYGRMFGIDRRDLINDDLDALTAVPRRLGRGGALKLNEVFWSTFLDNATFFTASNNNYAEGADTALGIDALTQAETMFLDQTDPDGHPLAVAPVILLVPNALYVPATQIMNSTELRDPGSSKKTPVANPHAGKFRPVRSSYLSNPKYTGNSTKAWYLLADPNDMPVIEVAFLNGQQQPTVESADADFNNLGIQMRGYHDFGCALQEPRGGVRMKGEV
jgi:phage major head subunit gpT-like protein